MLPEFCWIADITIFIMSAIRSGNLSRQQVVSLSRFPEFYAKGLLAGPGIAFFLKFLFIFCRGGVDLVDDALGIQAFF